MFQSFRERWRSFIAWASIIKDVIRFGAEEQQVVEVFPRGFMMFVSRGRVVYGGLFMFVIFDQV
jgi:hypothetical protein